MATTKFLYSMLACITFCTFATEKPTKIIENQSTHQVTRSAITTTQSDKKANEYLKNKIAQADDQINEFRHFVTQYTATFIISQALDIDFNDISKITFNVDIFKPTIKIDTPELKTILKAKNKNAISIQIRTTFFEAILNALITKIKAKFATEILALQKDFSKQFEQGADIKTINNAFNKASTDIMKKIENNFKIIFDELIITQTDKTAAINYSAENLQAYLTVTSSVPTKEPQPKQWSSIHAYQTAKAQHKLEHAKTYSVSMPALFKKMYHSYFID